MKINETKLKGVFVIEPDVFTDERGVLMETFNQEFAARGLVSSFKDSLYSINKKNVIRGMHFQTPPQDQVKLVYVSYGSILDVILDIRKDSPTYGEYVTVELSDKNHLIAYIPGGFAHGFVTLEDNSCVVYMRDPVRSPEHESGVNINSFGMDWKIKNPIVSKKDQALPSLADYESPFVYKK